MFKVYVLKICNTNHTDNADGMNDIVQYIIIYLVLQRRYTMTVLYCSNY